jgi:hypothetical protein
MDFDPTRALVNIRAADTDDLLDRVTAYRAGMEPGAVELIEGELRRRGVEPATIEARRAEVERTCLFDEGGSARMCSLCRRPAVAEAWGWFRLFGWLPVLPRRMRYCETHRPQQS